jgi:hypothetical protein
MGLFDVLSVFGCLIKGMIWLQPEQVWTGNVTHHHRPLLCPSLHSWCFCLEKWCKSVVLYGFLSILVIVKWTQESVMELIKLHKRKEIIWAQSTNAF